MFNQPVRVVKPGELSDSDFAAVQHLISEGGEVATARLAEFLRSSHRIALKTCDGQLACVGAIKAVKPTYIQTISRKSGYRLDKENCEGEFGYVVTKEAFRRRGLARELSTALLNDFGGALYATTRDDNAGIQDIVRETGFEHVGQKWRSVEHPNSSVMLWLRRR